MHATALLVRGPRSLQVRPGVPSGPQDHLATVGVQGEGLAGAETLRPGRES